MVNNRLVSSIMARDWGISETPDLRPKLTLTCLAQTSLRLIVLHPFQFEQLKLFNPRITVEKVKVIKFHRLISIGTKSITNLMTSFKLTSARGNSYRNSCCTKFFQKSEKYAL